MRATTSETPDFQAQPPRVQDALGLGHVAPVLDVVPIGFDGGFEAPNGDSSRAR
ncbi:MAG TPA: hypothetical protein VH583_24810 [Vicinamibacterales bacterium]|jgi:hypothetical protein